MQKMLFPIPLPSAKPPRNRKNNHRVKRNGNICVLYGELKMNLEERIKAGMLFYESGHVDPVNQEIEERLENERKDCKELMFDYNHCRPGDQDRQLKILKELLGS